MSYKSCLTFLSLTIAALFFGAPDARACSCGPTPTVLDSYEAADQVVITRAVSVEKAEQAAPDGRTPGGVYYVDGVRSTRMIVERIFKGSLKVGEEITFGQGGGADCVWTFNEKSVGEQFLFYLHSREKNPAVWHGFGCGRSGGLRHVADDLLYLNKLDKVRGKSRISGTLRFDGGEGLSVERRRVRITGAGKIYEAKTDANGVYEIYDVPAGQYLVEPETPPGWKVNEYYLGYASSFAGLGADKSAKKILLNLEDKKHASLDIQFEIDNALRGKVYDPEGKLMRGVCVGLAPVHGPVPQYLFKSDCTEAAGTFEITKIPAGSYVLAVNGSGKISSSAPFKTFYYPDVSERERATLITIGAGDTLEGFDVRVPKMEATVTLEGVFLYSDGKPVAGESVGFKVAAAAAAKDSVEGDARAKTDAKGRFTLKILKGLEGELSGKMYTYEGEFKNCPQLDAVVKQSGGRTATVVTNVVEIQAGGDLKGLELRFPFPGCEKVKRPEGEK
jgi:hypothetical protein